MSETRVKLGSAFDPRMIRDDQWTFRGYSPDGEYRLWTYTDPALDITIEKKEPTFTNEILKLNQEQLKDSSGKKWGEGRVAARIPLNVFYKDFAGRHDDPDFTNWYLNNPENEAWRTFKGRL